MRSTRFGATPNCTIFPGVVKSSGASPTSPKPKSARASSSRSALAGEGSTSRSRSFV